MTRRKTGKKKKAEKMRVYPNPVDGWCAVSSNGLNLLMRVGFGYTLDQAKARAKQHFIGGYKFIRVRIVPIRERPQRGAKK